MRSFGAFAGSVHGISRFSGGGYGFGQSLCVRFGGRLLRFGNGLGRDHRFGAKGRDRRGRLVGMIVVVMIVPAVMTMVVMIVSVIGMMVVVRVFMVIMIVVIMFVVVMGIVLAVMLRVGVQMLALLRSALGVLRQDLALDRLRRGIGAGVEAFDDVAADAFAVTAAAGVAVTRAAAAVRAVLALFLGFAMGLFLGLDQRLPVGNRDLVVVGMDFAEGEEAVAVAAIFDERGLERGFDPGDLGEVDIPAQLLALRGLEIKLFDAIAADHDDPGLLRVGGIDQHLVGHVLTLDGGGRDSPWARIAPPGDATVHLIRG
ncbi:MULTISPECIES: hypothetical protein [Bradyrhizobium]|uniref:Uncharacterized protein n=1 Tax=Bradyrhizobium diazoefficiens TaxID=1355477 RepID=A0A810BHN9_9BRAD|nr:hypothetical protein [Bradyrhizobium diazoefficiens]MBP1065688.1 hypothetical protein [Bradyrhizobium japonicum]WLA70265.1 hypothetical protein QIH77_25535 [Bradyrhizobium diazoefficiens]WLB34368.1 hypothetical protein QIH78_22935 [Bradyrhizobium diazoefficiens]WLC20561.1 hypothetical protein QIH76_20370 [Bradyrhizobium diazoefficiens]BCE21931.1 hypothetical protein XF1B_46120 [Bradyrhizobium diazoefficiens]